MHRALAPITLTPHFLDEWLMKLIINKIFIASLLYRDRDRVSVFIYFPEFALDVETSFKLKLLSSPVHSAWVLHMTIRAEIVSLSLSLSPSRDPGSHTLWAWAWAWAPLAGSRKISLSSQSLFQRSFRKITRKIYWILVDFLAWRVISGLRQQQTNRERKKADDQGHFYHLLLLASFAQCKFELKFILNSCFSKVRSKVTAHARRLIATLCAFAINHSISWARFCFIRTHLRAR